MPLPQPLPLRPPFLLLLSSLAFISRICIFISLGYTYFIGLCGRWLTLFRFLSYPGQAATFTRARFSRQDIQLNRAMLHSMVSEKLIACTV